ncbi:TPA: hypothetical protein DCZ46_00570 [Candidatus Campbellbacteria bacterium]|nr:MAG: seg [Candidatus Campbellbacteria bacterium GW2011_OD1_34_28]KKP75419.1 MAG: hypothetical protein UR74_C0001G0275 [Candidatus Campbellbacteria bacterium GW2011_GWD2_35_24]KKP76020.1 MAG: hypothetical protein UR75_C0001G0054 [Candidatus Campbellbacteria bacterium GW2011_GWC2_35_28]KKP77209.1 MAG: hypothetical protein UR76_C0001G0054 [Candidatus Campbellbacteria bacterium GW2011_GWC1_35_31]KKP79138.1 MAG: hypothetical protein UR79_C0001G0054 [Candidatus Campbellbacteria bacterium GW2011_GW
MFLKKRKEKKKGFVILIAVLLAGIFVVIGASILLISIKELELASGGTQSQYAFYASDTGLDCAFYWDLKHHIFATSTSDNIEPTAASNIYCAGVNIVEGDSWEWLAGDLGQGPSNDFTGNTIFSIDDLYPNDPSRDDCVLIYVIKKNQNTYIESRGYNTCDENNPRRVERALRATY